MKFGPVPLEEAEGKILGHNVAGRDGRRRLRKGRALDSRDIESLRELGRSRVYVAELEPGDVDENQAARRLAEAGKGQGLRLKGSITGRINLLAQSLGMFRVDGGRLTRLNVCEGLTLASLASHSVARPGQVVATVKVIPYAIPERILTGAETLAREGGALFRVDALTRKRVSVVLSGSPSLKNSLFEAFHPLEERVEALGSTIDKRDFVTLEDDSGERLLTETLNRHRADGIELILLAGETAIMDREDITPRALERAGGTVECVGAPVDPGNLLMLGYLGAVPVVGAPGCARSRKPNVVDWILPRLLAGDRLTRNDVVELGAGGLLEDVPERPFPRSRVE